MTKITVTIEKDGETIVDEIAASDDDAELIDQLYAIPARFGQNLDWPGTPQLTKEVQAILIECYIGMITKAQMSPTEAARAIRTFAAGLNARSEGSCNSKPE